MTIAAIGGVGVRAIWSGAISFGLVNIPVRLYKATEDAKLDFNLLHESDFAPIRYARVCTREGREVDLSEIVRGYEYEKGEYVVIGEDDFKRVEGPRSKAIEIVDFAHESEIDSIYFEKPYYLEPDKGAGKAYVLLREALKESGKVGIARFVLRNRERLGAVKAQDDVIMLNQLRFQQEIRTVPKWIETVGIRSELEEREITYLVCQDEATLVYLANLGCIEMNPWNSRLHHLDYPDYLVLDLDPLDIGFEAVVEAALAIRRVLCLAGARSFCKTSGATGLHVYVPMGARYHYEQIRRFAEIVAHLVHSVLPRTTSVERNPSKRRGRVYLDCLQNRRGQTIVAPYSLRARPGAPVSTPLKWEEVRRGLDPSTYTMKTILERIDKNGDIFRPILDERTNLEECVENLIKATIEGRAS